MAPAARTPLRNHPRTVPLAGALPRDISQTDALTLSMIALDAAPPFGSAIT